MSTSKDNLNDRLSAYLDGELSAEESAALERTLAVDAALRLELEELAEVKRMVGHLPRHAAPASMKSAIREQFERRSLLHHADSAGQPRRPGFRFLRVLSMAATVVLATAVGATVWQHLHPPQGGDANLTMGELAKGNHLDDAAPSAPSVHRSPSTDAPAGTSVASADLDRAKKVADGWKDADRSKPGDRDAHRAGLEDAAGGSRGGGSGSPPPRSVRPEGLSAKTGPVAEAEGATRGAGMNAGRGASLSLDESFDKGPVTAGDVAKLQFNNEAVQIDVPVTDAKQQEKVIADARQTIREYGGNEIGELAANTRLTPNDHQFVYRGQPNLNFAQNGNQSQIVLRANSEVIGKVVDQVQKDANGQAQFNVQSSRLRETKRDAVEQVVRRQSRAGQTADNSGNSNVSQSGNGIALAKPSGLPGNVAPGTVARSGYAGEHSAGKMPGPAEISGKPEAGVAAGQPAPTAVAVAPRVLPATPAVAPSAPPTSQPNWEGVRGIIAGNQPDSKLPGEKVATADGQVETPGRAGTDALTTPASRPDLTPMIVKAGPCGEEERNLPQAATVAVAPGPAAQPAGQLSKDVVFDRKAAGRRGDDMLDVVINVYVPTGASQGQVQPLNARPPQQQVGPNSQIRQPLTEAATQAEKPASAPASH